MSDEPTQVEEDDEIDEEAEADPEAWDVIMPAPPPAEPIEPHARQTPARRMIAPPPEHTL